MERKHVRKRKVKKLFFSCFDIMKNNGEKENYKKKKTPQGIGKSWENKLSLLQFKISLNYIYF